MHLSLSLYTFLLVLIRMVFGLWSEIKIFVIVAIFFTFLCLWSLPHYETVKFVPLPPDVGKPRSSVLMFHEAIYQGLIVCFTPLEVFPRLVCGRAKSELSTHSVSLGTPSHLRVVVSTFNQGLSSFGHIGIWCSTSRLYNPTGAPPRSTLVGVLQSLSFRPRLLLLSAPYALSSGP